MEPAKPWIYPFTQFPEINGQKFGFTVSSTPLEEEAYINYVVTSKAALEPTNYNGDFPLPTTGITAFEMQLKIPTPPPTGDSSYTSSFWIRGITDNGYAIQSDFGFQSGTHDPDFGENPPILFYSLSYQLSDGSGPSTVGHYQRNKITSSTNNYQRLGVYINQQNRSDLSLMALIKVINLLYQQHLKILVLTLIAEFLYIPII